MVELDIVMMQNTAFSVLLRALVLTMWDEFEQDSHTCLDLMSRWTNQVQTESSQEGWTWRD